MTSVVNSSSKFGRTKHRREWVWGEGVSLPHREGTGKGLFLFYDLEMAYFGEFCGAQFKVFLYRELPRWGSDRFCGKLWISRAKQRIKDIIKCCHWARMTNIGMLYPKVRNNIGGYAHWRPLPQPKYWGWRQCYTGGNGDHTSEV